MWYGQAQAAAFALLVWLRTSCSTVGTSWWKNASWCDMEGRLFHFMSLSFLILVLIVKQFVWSNPFRVNLVCQVPAKEVAKSSQKQICMIPVLLIIMTIIKGDLGGGREQCCRVLTSLSGDLWYKVGRVRKSRDGSGESSHTHGWWSEIIVQSREYGMESTHASYLPRSVNSFLHRCGRINPLQNSYQIN